MAVWLKQDKAMAYLTHTIENSLAVVVLDNPPRNRLSPQVLDELSTALVGGWETATLVRCFCAPKALTFPSAVTSFRARQ